MTTIEVTASKSYPVQIGPGLLTELGEKTAALGKVKKVCIVSDSNVWPLYGAAADTSLHLAGLETCAFVFPAGESSKNGDTFLELLNFLAENRLSREDVLVALGGGVVGDLTGFAAACYLRGIRFVQVPTTVLAAVDSSVGGKTAIDLGAGKNLAGAFWQPSYVLCDVNTLAAVLTEDFSWQGVLDCAVPLLYTGVLSSGVAFSLQILGQQHLPPEPASLIMSLESVFAVLAGWVLLHQTLSPIELLGCALVFAAVILSQTKSK